MTEKRFDWDLNGIWDYQSDNDEYLEDSEEICKLLNELYEERSYFERKKCEYWNKFNLAHLDNINLRKENEQLKYHLNKTEKELQEYKDFMSLG